MAELTTVEKIAQMAEKGALARLRRDRGCNSSRSARDPLPCQQRVAYLKAFQFVAVETYNFERRENCSYQTH
jgi:hypothetical protein